MALYGLWHGHCTIIAALHWPMLTKPFSWWAALHTIWALINKEVWRVWLARLPQPRPIHNSQASVVAAEASPMSTGSNFSLLLQQLIITMHKCSSTVTALNIYCDLCILNKNFPLEKSFQSAVCSGIPTTTSDLIITWNGVDLHSQRCWLGPGLPFCALWHAMWSTACPNIHVVQCIHMY